MSPVMKHCFLSHVLTEATPLFGGSGVIALKQERSIIRGDSANSSSLAFPAHVGTHVDAPHHFDPNGTTLDQYPPGFWICRRPFVSEVAAEPGELITVSKLEPALRRMPVGSDLLLLRTGFEQFRNAIHMHTYIFEGPGIEPEVGVWLREKYRLKMIGFDFLSLSSYCHREPGRQAHRAFLLQGGAYGGMNLSGDPILIIEDMHLAETAMKMSSVIVTPLRYAMADGAPVTVIGTSGSA